MVGLHELRFSGVWGMGIMVVGLGSCCLRDIIRTVHFCSRI